MGQPITHRPPQAQASVLSPSMDYKADDAYKYCAVQSGFGLQTNELLGDRYRQTQPIEPLLRRTPVLLMTRAGLCWTQYETPDRVAARFAGSPDKP